MISYPHKHTSPILIAVLTDIHYGDSSMLLQRRSDIADLLLLRAVHRLNRFIKPDYTVILGDVLDDGGSPDAHLHRKHIRSILDILDSPYIVIPGNHDGDHEDFYRDFPHPIDRVEFDDVCFLPFIDTEAPGYNATRSDSEINRFSQARNECGGHHLVALQHVCLHPPGHADIPYNYTNAESIITAMKQAGVVLSISGHYHNGAELISDKGISFINAPGLCEYPFYFSTIKLNHEKVILEKHQLAIPASLHLVDNHVHTELAYCQENMSVVSAINFAHAVGLHGLGFAEHSGQLYFPSETYWGGGCYKTGIADARLQYNRVNQYLQLKSDYGNDSIRFGLEVDIDYKGHLLLKSSDTKKVDFLLGSIHSLPHIKMPNASILQLSQEFLDLLEHLLKRNVKAIAHPFRVFKRANLPTPSNLYHPVSDLLAKYNTAAEINFHINEPPLPFMAMCLEKGVKFTLGSDAHNLYELGEFTPHMQLLRDAGYDGDLDDILINL